MNWIYREKQNIYQRKRKSILKRLDVTAANDTLKKKKESFQDKKLPLGNSLIRSEPEDIKTWFMGKAKKMI